MNSFKNIAVNLSSIKVEPYNELSVSRRLGERKFRCLYEGVDPIKVGLSMLTGSYGNPLIVNIAFVKEIQRKDGKFYQLIEDLLRLGADPNAVFSRWGQFEVFMSALAFAKSIEDQRLIQLLTKYGAKPELERLPA